MFGLPVSLFLTLHLFVAEQYSFGIHLLLQDFGSWQLFEPPSTTSLQISFEESLQSELVEQLTEKLHLKLNFHLYLTQ